MKLTPKPLTMVNSNLSKKQAKRTAEHFQLLTDLENKEQFYGKICGKAFEEQENQYKVRTNGKEKSLVKIQKKEIYSLFYCIKEKSFS